MLRDYLFFFSFLPSFFIVILSAVSTTASTFITFSIYKALNTIAPCQFFQSFLRRNQIVEISQLRAKSSARKKIQIQLKNTLASGFDFKAIQDKKEFGRSMGEIFENFDVNPLGSASIAQVHRAILRGDKNDVVVKVQHPGIRDLMMTDIHNLQAFVLFIQKTDIKFDLFSITREMEKQVFVFTLMFLAKHIYPSFMYFSDM
ncbi:hypothetical protein E1A91_A07G177200v1 [Gossypium mustelinum]|uniref:ABC1 atypical kinase-like domain-containing protein n=4 Tax=Gossypium TaxID=3633 RepID=A0A5D2YMU3_GOSMU|nr:hypothetical protein E1A91_A07G177200v1 [Gossypium mustelinum]